MIPRVGVRGRENIPTAQGPDRTGGEGANAGQHSVAVSGQDHASACTVLHDYRDGSAGAAYVTRGRPKIGDAACQGTRLSGVRGDRYGICVQAGEVESSEVAWPLRVDDEPPCPYVAWAGLNRAEYQDSLIVAAQGRDMGR
ncbi:hypothetical protein Psuf_009950 [Phytohabitans suffuscus]|uniref:Uncharacterized protein n=1 Tax=Phytohabitans suffuscus TaxID=624315 RepID=A0A6F8YC50_9ACTN|nr:hypothetical protein Psuf_009950 [Phytohabitans suffuscus]